MLADPTVWASMLGAYGAGTLGNSLLGRLAMKGTVKPDARAVEKGQNTRLTNQLLSQFSQNNELAPTLNRERSFDPYNAHARPDKMEANVSYFSHPAIAAHELGHLQNEQQDQQSLLGRMRRFGTNMAYSPLALIGPVLAGLGYMTGIPHGHEIGMLGTGLTAAGTGAQLMEEGRASSKALKSMQQLRGKTEAQDVLPLAGGLGTYGLAGASAIGLPLLGGYLTGSFGH